MQQRGSGSCPRCFTLFRSAASALAHRRHCREPPLSADVVIERPQKRARLVGVFYGDVNSRGQPLGLGPGGGVRREDECVMVPMPSEALPQRGEAGDDRRLEDVLNTKLDTSLPVDPQAAVAFERGSEWTGAASQEEVLEALRRTLLYVGAATGAKTCDLIMKLLQHPSLGLNCPALTSGLVSHRDLVRDANTQVDDSLRSLQFEQVEVDDRVGDDGRAGMWLRDPVAVIQRQVEKLRNGAKDTSVLYMDAFKHIDSSGERLISHPLSTDLAHTVQSKVRARVQWGNAQDEKGVRGWRDGHDFVMFLQVYSDKSLQTMKTSSHTHYPLHVAVANTSLTMKESLICRGDCVVAYLPTNIKWDPEEAKHYATDLDDAGSGRGSRESKLRIQHAAIEKCLAPLLSQTVRGFEVRDSTGEPFRCHPILWSYVTDLPEGWDLSSSIHGRCSRCTVGKSSLGSTDPCPRKDVSTAVMFYDDLERPHSKARLKSVARNLKETCSMNSVRPYLLSLGPNYGIDVFRCLRYEVMHNIHLGLTKMLLECMSQRLRSTTLTTPEFVLKSTGQNKCFGTMRTSILRALNLSLQLYERHSPVVDFRIAHRSMKRTTDLNGLFKKDGVASMLEARDYSRILQMMPFLGATCDRLCGEPGTTARLFTEYVELVFQMTRAKSLTAAFSFADLDELRISVTRFMNSVRDLYGEFQASDTGTPKMHALLHVVADIQEAGALAHNRADAYEASHKIIKAAYRTGSMRGDEGHTEALQHQSRADFLRQSSGTTIRGARIEVVSLLSERSPRVRGARTTTKVEAVSKDSVQLVRSQLIAKSGLLFTFLEAFKRSGCLVRQTLLPPRLREMMRDVGGLHDFCWFMNKLELGRTDSVSRAKSAYVSGFPLPVVEKSIDGKSILVSVDRPGDCDPGEGRAHRELQRVVAAHRFHKSKFPIQQTVMIDAGGPQATMEKLDKSARGKYSGCSLREVWVGKVLAFLSVTRRRPGKRVGATYTKDEVALVQYFDISTEPDDDVDKALNCTKLNWAREYDDGTQRNANPRSARGVYDVVDIAAIRGFVHVIRGDYGLEKTRTYRCAGDRYWFKSWFYINRFKLPPRGSKVSTEADEQEEADEDY